MHPGDEIRILCRYDSTDRNTTSHFGLNNTDERCTALLTYYPFQPFLGPHKTVSNCGQYEQYGYCNSLVLPIPTCRANDAQLQVIGHDISDGCDYSCSDECMGYIDALENTGCLEGNGLAFFEENWPALANVTIYCNNTRPSYSESTTASQSELSTTASQSELSNTASQSELSTTASQSELSNTASQSELSTTASQRELSTTASQSELSNTASQSELSTTASRVSSLPLLPSVSSLPLLPRVSSLPLFPRMSSLPLLPRVSSLPLLPRVSSLPLLLRVSSLPLLPHADTELTLSSGKVIPHSDPYIYFYFILF